MRGSAVVLAVALALTGLIPGAPAAASTAELVQHLDHLVGSFPGGAGLWIAAPNASKPLYSHDADEPIITASLYKLAVLAEAERRVDAGQLHYSDIITIENEDITEDGSFEAAGTELTLDQALEAMVTISDNGAALDLWHVLGADNINATLRNAGIIYTPSGPRGVVAMTWDAYEAETYAFIANVGSIVYSTILEPPANARYEVPRTTLSVDVGSSPRITIPITNAGSDAWNGS